MNPGKIAPNEKASVLEGGRQRARPAAAARTEDQIDRLIRNAPGALDIFSPPRKREAAFESVADQDRPSVGRRTVHYTDRWVGGHIGVLVVRLDDPRSFRVRVDHVVDGAVIFDRSGRVLKLCLTIISAGNEGYGMRTIRISKGTGQPCIAVGIKAVRPTQRRAEFTHGLIHLDAAADGRLLIPQQAALDVHVL